MTNHYKSGISLLALVTLLTSCSPRIPDGGRMIAADPLVDLTSFCRAAVDGGLFERGDTLIVAPKTAPVFAVNSWSNEVRGRTTNDNEEFRYLMEQETRLRRDHTSTPIIAHADSDWCIVEMHHTGDIYDVDPSAWLVRLTGPVALQLGPEDVTETGRFLKIALGGINYSSWYWITSDSKRVAKLDATAG